MTDSDTLVVPWDRQLSQPALAGPTDAELLARWFADVDRDALGAVVRRHGRMVLGVCQSVLGRNPDADDAFQATFLVLLRKGGGLANPGQVAGWLHRVALRTARKARTTRGRRWEREVLLVDPVAPEPPADTSDLRRVLDEELDRLPDEYRLPIVLCELEGRTLAEAAELLGWPKGTVAGRLSRGRDRLRQRLTRRRLCLPLFLLGGGGSAAQAGGPSDRLVTATVTTATSPTGPPDALASAVVRDTTGRSRYGLLALIILLFVSAGGVAAVRREAGGRSRPAIPSGLPPSPPGGPAMPAGAGPPAAAHCSDR